MSCPSCAQYHISPAPLAACRKTQLSGSDPEQSLGILLTCSSPLLAMVMLQPLTRPESSPSHRERRSSPDSPDSPPEMPPAAHFPSASVTSNKYLRTVIGAVFATEDLFLSSASGTVS